MEDDFSGPLKKGVQKYEKLIEYTTKLAIAAENHPDIVYDMSDQFQRLSSMGSTDYDPGMSQAAEELPLYSYFVSEAWSEAQEYFMFDLEQEFREHLEQEEDDYSRQRKEKDFARINAMYDIIDTELWELNEEITGVIDNPPAEPPQNATRFRIRHKPAAKAD